VIIHYNHNFLRHLWGGGARQIPILPNFPLNTRPGPPARGKNKGKKKERVVSAICWVGLELRPRDWGDILCIYFFGGGRLLRGLPDSLF